HPLDKELVQLSSASSANRNLHGGANKVIFDRSAFCIFLVAEYKAVQPMYGASTRDFCLLEAGYISQLLMMECPDFDLGLCPIGGMDFEPLREDFALSDSQEMIHSFMGGGISEEQKGQLIQTMPQGDEEPLPTVSLTDTLKEWLHQSLPEYMVPYLYVQLPGLPLTANGKIDRKALPAPDLSRASSQTAKPATELETRLLRLIQERLKNEAIGLDDDFFDIGANSLDMVQLFNAVKAEFQRKVTVADIFSHASVRKLATLLAQAPKETVSDVSSEKKTIVPQELDAEQIDQLTKNIDNLSEEEIELLLIEFGEN
ncbi:MAG: non-ribosomal peptide synthetase, partial [Candidatus Electrothrix sp. AW2]|nr:non-ribosomal peptide synthetase [Candidatus Electrothrix gigas]